MARSPSRDCPNGAGCAAGTTAAASSFANSSAMFISTGAAGSCTWWNPKAVLSVRIHPRYAAGHGSPYLEDLRVPVLFYGANLNPAIIDRARSRRATSRRRWRERWALPSMEDWEKAAGRGDWPARRTAMTKSAKRNYKQESGRSFGAIEPMDTPAPAGCRSRPAGLRGGLEHGGHKGAAFRGQVPAT